MSINNFETDVLKMIVVNQDSRVPKYKQIVESIIDNITKGNLKVGQKIPSINMFSEEFYLSRHTVEKAYNILKSRKIISPTRGKGYYVSGTSLVAKKKILFLINKLSSYKMRVYNSFLENIDQSYHTDLHIYHCDASLFLNLLEKNLGGYDYYVIMPHFKTEELRHISSTDEVFKAIGKIPKDRLVIMDNNKLEALNPVIEISQDFENDIYNALKEGLSRIVTYQKLILIYPEKSVYPYPRRILHGFRKFCVENDLDFEIIDEIYEDMVLKKGDLYITIEESDLVNLVKQVRDRGLNLGDEIGIISYNDTPLKELLGITVVSTDFKLMGQSLAKMIMDKAQGKVKNPFRFIKRDSL